MLLYSPLWALTRGVLSLLAPSQSSLPRPFPDGVRRPSSYLSEGACGLRDSHQKPFLFPLLSRPILLQGPSHGTQDTGACPQPRALVGSLGVGDLVPTPSPLSGQPQRAHSS